MKKILFTVTVMLSMLSMADAKSDIDKANKLLSENKVQETVDLLKSIEFKNGEEKEFEEVNFSLYQLSNNDKDRKYYLEKTMSNKDSKGEFAILANYILASYEKNNKKKLALTEELNKRTDFNNVNYLREYSLALYLNKKYNEAYKINARFDKEATLDQKKDYYLILLSKLYQNGLENEAVKLVNKALDLDNKDNRYTSNVYIVVASWQKDKKDIRKYLELAYSVNKSVDLAADILVVSINNKDKNLENKYANIILNTKEEGRILNNSSIARYIYFKDNNLIDNSIEYAKKALKAKEKGAKELLEELNKIKNAK